jgi:zinc D-Ala-D-Ala carboxypeptidase
MTSSAGLSSVASRVGQIRSRLVSMTRSSSSLQSSSSSLQSSNAIAGSADGSATTGTTGATGATMGFDPFGAAYQQALLGAGVGAAGSESGMSSAFTDTSNDNAVLRGPVLVRSRVESLNGTSLSGVSSLLARSGASDDTAVVGSAFGVSANANVGKVGGYGAITIPPELAGYGNGEIPTAALELIGQGSHRLYAPAAEAWKQTVAAAKADGIDLKITDSYRTYDQQVDLAGRKGLYANGGLAAVPGTSNHGWGLAVDVDVTAPATRAWLQANGHGFGFVQQSAREPWHWEFRPAQA